MLDKEPPIKEVDNTIWLSVSEAAVLGGVRDKTIRRAIKNDPKLRYKIVKNRYQIDFGSLISFLYKNTKLKNKLILNGLGQYVHFWKHKKNKIKKPPRIPSE